MGRIKMFRVNTPLLMKDEHLALSQPVWLTLPCQSPSSLPVSYLTPELSAANTRKIFKDHRSWLYFCSSSSSAVHEKTSTLCPLPFLKSSHGPRPNTDSLQSLIQVLVLTQVQQGCLQSLLSTHFCISSNALQIK